MIENNSGKVKLIIILIYWEFWGQIGATKANESQPKTITDYINNNNISHLIAFPTFYKLLLNYKNIDPQKLNSLLYIISSGSRYV